MTEFDQKLIAIALQVSPESYSEIRRLIPKAETIEAYDRLNQIYRDKLNLIRQNH